MERNVRLLSGNKKVVEKLIYYNTKTLTNVVYFCRWRKQVKSGQNASKIIILFAQCVLYSAFHPNIQLEVAN